MKKVLGGTGAALAAKLVTGFAIAALAAAGATEAVITNSANPAVWGQQVVAQVQKCKAALTSGQHGIGQCVSAFARTHGPTVSENHSSGARTNGKDKGKDNGKGKPANPGSQGTGGQPGDKSHGRPTPTSEPGT